MPYARHNHARTQHCVGEAPRTSTATCPLRASRRGAAQQLHSLQAISQQRSNVDNATMAEAPAPAPSAEDELATKILRQVEYYFSDDSYPFDEYIRSQEKDGMISASRGAAAPSRHRRASSPGEEVVGGLFFEFEAVRTDLTEMLCAGPFYIIVARRACRFRSLRLPTLT